MIDSEFKKEYLSRIHVVQDYIERNLENNFSLEELAIIAGFSKYHFHRIFKSIVNETLFQYINRIKIEKASSFLMHNPNMSITEISYKFGFTDSATFSRSFKKYYDISASEYRSNYSNNCKIDSKESKDLSITSRYNKSTPNIIWEDVNMKIKGNVEVLDIEDMDVIYVRHTGAYRELGNVFPSLMNKLLGWAMARDLIDMKGDMKLLAIYHDNPEITPEDQQRTSLCLGVSKDVEVSSEISKMIIPSGKYAIGHFELNADQFGEAWDYLYGEWLINSGFQPGDGLSFEMYRNDPNTHPEKKSLVDIYLPVKPL